MPEAKVRIAYTGTALQDGSMDVLDLAPALLAFAGFIQRANELVGNKQPVKISLNADDIHKGSFDITLCITSFLEQAKIIFGIAETSGLIALLEIIGYSRGVLSIFDLIKFCKGKKPEKVEPTENGVSVSANNSTVNVTNNVINIFNDTIARAQLERIMKPLRTEGIEAFEVRNNATIEDKKPLVSVEKDEGAFFTTLKADDENINEYSDSQTLIFDIISVSFGEKYKWRFSDGGTPFSASVEDEEFLKRVAAAEQTFCNGDKIRAECTTIQKLDANGNLTTKKIITKVLEYIPTPQQEKLF